MPNDEPRHLEASVDGSTERHIPVARYVEFGDEEIQSLFVVTAEEAFQRLVAADRTEGRGEVELCGTPQPGRRGLFRRATATPDRAVPATAALVRVAGTVVQVPCELDVSPNGCSSSRRVARIIAAVTSDLLGDLLTLDPTEQTEHPAYRQTLRLAAELEGVRRVVIGAGCTKPHCVGIRLPENWGRRVEDAEISEVRLVLHELAAHASTVD